MKSFELEIINIFENKLLLIGSSSEDDFYDEYDQNKYFKKV